VTCCCSQGSRTVDCGLSLLVLPLEFVWTCFLALTFPTCCIVEDGCFLLHLSWRLAVTRQVCLLEARGARRAVCRSLWLPQAQSFVWSLISHWVPQPSKPSRLQVEVLSGHPASFRFKTRARRTILEAVVGHSVTSHLSTLAESWPSWAPNSLVFACHPQDHMLLRLNSNSAGFSPRSSDDLEPQTLNLFSNLHADLATNQSCRPFFLHLSLQLLTWLKVKLNESSLLQSIRLRRLARYLCASCPPFVNPLSCYWMCQFD